MARRSKLVGSEQPRIFTPPLRELTPETTYGYSVIQFAEEVLEVGLYPWQKWLLIHALERREADGGLRFRNVVVLVARQNGKSMLSVVLSLWMLYVMGVRLVISTAQDLDVAEEIWQEGVEIVEENDELNDLKDKIIKMNGKKALVLKTGERWKVKAANRRAGRGLSGDFILLDELREHQNWEAWGAITKTTMARPNAQVWALSNAGDATSVVLRHLRKISHKALGDPDRLDLEDAPLADEAEGEALMADADLGEDSLGIFEWSAPPDCDRLDREFWPLANPSLGHGTITERTIASAASTDPEWIFRTEVLCQWSDGSLEGPFPPGSWESGIDEDSQIAEDSDLAFGLDVSGDRSAAYICVAGDREDGSTHVESVIGRAGTEWVADWFRTRVDEYGGMRVALQARGAPVSSLIDELEEIEGLEVVKWAGEELGKATGLLWDAVSAHTKDDIDPAHKVWHLPYPPLDIAAATAVTRIMSGGATVWDRNKSAQDAAPLIAANAAYWLSQIKPETPFVSVYETDGVFVV